MKKLILLILILGAVTKIFACSCVRKNIAQTYLDADVVALIIIEKTYGDRDSHIMQGGRLYSADVKVEKIYKGNEFKTLHVFGTTTSASSGACEKLIEKGEKYLVLLSKNKDGEYYVSSCSTMPQISDDKYVKEYENIFKVLDKNKSNLQFPKFAQYEDLSEDYNYITRQNTNDFLKLNAKQLHGKVGIYKVKINDKGNIFTITPIEEIGIKEKQIQELMKKNLRIYDGFDTVAGEYFILLEL